jgi:hypothetical protein
MLTRVDRAVLMNMDMLDCDALLTLAAPAIEGFAQSAVRRTGLYRTRLPNPQHELLSPSPDPIEKT